jgi:hypothetical protein
MTRAPGRPGLPAGTSVIAKQEKMIMSSAVSTEKIVGTHTIHGVTVKIQRITWNNDPGLSYDVLDAAGEYLTDESFDDYPTEEQITDVLREPAETFCLFCQQGIIGNSGHLIGNAEPGSNPWCCDGCWDERLR